MSDPGLRGRTCVVTGASAGIGQAIALALASAAATVYAVARRPHELDAVAARAGAGELVPCPADLTVDGDVHRLAEALRERGTGVDALVHSAGLYATGPIEAVPVAELDRLYAANVRAPYLLTQALLPELRAREGQVVFINSTVTQAARAGVAQFAATQHALKAIADTLREEVNADGIRVLNVYPGRTATPRQARIHAHEGRPYAPERLLQPEDVADVVMGALVLPRTAEVMDVTVRPMRKS
jgi:NADP-dependent 3-hydroxy acid dehydrogenase YdfG